MRTRGRWTSVAPSVGRCLELLTWKGCGVSTCEWRECMEDLALQDPCDEPPLSCAGVLACDDAEG